MGRREPLGAVGDVAWTGAFGADELELYGLLERPEWHRRANCRGLTGLFFPERASGVDVGALIDDACRLCKSCPVFDDCAQAGLEERDGIRAGTTGEERRRVRAWMGQTPG
jgi:hypothetical protein